VSREKRIGAVRRGEVEVIVCAGDREVRLGARGPGDFVGEEAIFGREAHPADVRAVTAVRVLGVDRRNFLRRASEDPTLVFRIVQQLGRRTASSAMSSPARGRARG